MKLDFYPKYATRSLWRGGQRTLLALFCVAVGVMAIVGLQLVGGMIRTALVGNARVLNGGDLTVRSSTAPMSASDLAVFDELQRQGLLRAYSATYEDGVQTPGANGKRVLVQLRVVDPATFPLVGQPDLVTTTGGTFKTILSAPGGAVATSALLKALGATAGQEFRLTAGTDSRQLNLRLNGVLDDRSGVGSGNMLFVSQDTYRAASSQPFGYNAIFTTTSDATTADRAAKIINERLPLASTETATALLKQLKDQVDLVNRFLVIVGLLALLIGGVGIVNTMQVLLARRRVEIAMLKTAGYQRRDLALLFGLEAALLGLLGGAAGALAGIGVAALIRVLFERTFRLLLTFQLDWGVILGGVAVGLVTALIFALLPIVQAASVRPQAVLRELPEGVTWRNRAQSVGLVLLLSLLFAVLASSVIGSAIWGIAAVYGTFVALLLLSLVFGVVVLVLERLPVPATFSPRYLLLVTAATGASIALAVFVRDLRGIGLLLALATATGYAIVFAPAAWRASTKMAFRNLGRARARTTTTLLALFIGVFAVGLVLILGQGIRQTIDGFLAKQIRFNVIALMPATEAPAFTTALRDLPGLKQQETYNVVLASQPVSIGGAPIGTRIGQETRFSNDQISSQLAARLLTGVQGYDLAQGQLPQVSEVTAGRTLGPADAGTDNVMLDDSLQKQPVLLRVGETLEVVNQFTGQRRTLTVVGFYKTSSTGVSLNFNISPVLGSRELVDALGGRTAQAVYYLAIDPARTGDATTALSAAAPRAQVFNFADVLSQFGQVLDNLLVMVTAIASLALLAGVIIIANAVALAMLERRREIGILKSIGYTSRRVLGITLIENGVIGGLGSMLGMTIAAGATAIFAWQSGVTLGISLPTTVGLILGVALVAILTATLVAWGAARVRPLEAIRYE